METGKIPEVEEDKRMFKSYYVVWKPVGVPMTMISFTSLNRTMQYGNFIFIKYIITDKEV